MFELKSFHPKFLRQSEIMIQDLIYDKAEPFMVWY